MKARVRNTLWAATLVVGIALYVLPAVALVAFFALLASAVLLSVPRRPRDRAPHGQPPDPRSRFDSDPDVATMKHDGR